MKRYEISIQKIILTGLVLLMAVPVFNFRVAEAARLANRSIKVTAPEAGVTTTHTVQFDIGSTASVGSIEVEYCENNPFPGTPCTAATGMDITGASIGSQSGVTGFSVHGNTTANRLVLTRTAAVATAGTTARYVINDVDNPTTEDRSYFVRLRTFGSVDGTGASVDDGGAVFAITHGLGVTVYIPPFLEFCVAVTINNNKCSTAKGSKLYFGTLSKDKTKKATSQMTAATNADFGYAITVHGNTMTSGNNAISELNVPTASTKGANQFGINLVDNATPNVGSDPAGPGTATPVADYNTVNLFMYDKGDTLVSVGDTDNYRTFTTSYIVNVNKNQPGGVYTTTVSYICLANF